MSPGYASKQDVDELKVCITRSIGRVNKKKPVLSSQSGLGEWPKMAGYPKCLPKNKWKSEKNVIFDKFQSSCLG